MLLSVLFPFPLPPGSSDFTLDQSGDCCVTMTDDEDGNNSDSEATVMIASLHNHRSSTLAVY